MTFRDILEDMRKSTTNYFNIKYVALVLLVLQNTLVVVFTGYSRSTHGPMYASTTAVVITEVLKMFSCFLVIGFDSGGVGGLMKALNDEIISVPMELVKLAVPSILYTIQNNLLYVALSNLDPATFQVGYQLKILTTAVFSVLMLNKSISKLQWFSLVLLTLGVALCQLSSRQAAKSKGETGSNLVGCIAVLMATTLSGFAGVYFERILKGSPTSLWMRNVQMSFTSIIVGMITVRASTDWKSVETNGFFYGYTNIVWFVIFLQAVGGLLVAVVVKYTDNILKGFATSASIVTSSLLSIALFGFEPTGLFMLSASLVIYSMYLYSYQPPVINDSKTPDDSLPMLEAAEREKN